ncbi:hypothetical protein ACKC9G_07760 [Pokkaliibacter sp. CJK22405]|uniref:hypothetical protein n=1 Tax=Pokkaliibacter sp. CJK22405 TaxID=3384615 RepID=UPI0039847107
MNKYLDLEKTGVFSSIFMDYLSGKYEHPGFFVNQSADDPYILPAMIPFWVDGPNTFGLWKHWFVENRSDFFAKQTPEDSYKVQELGKNIEQFIILECFNEIVSEEDVTDEIEEFLAPLNIDIRFIREIYNQHGDSKDELLNIEYFKDGVPAIYASPYKKGVFSEEDFDLDGIDLYKYSTTEFSSQELDMIRNRSNAPAWFKIEKQKDFFYDALGKKDLQSAWLSLNSNGWSFLDARDAIIKLADQANDKNFSILANAWVNLPLHDYGSY